MNVFQWEDGVENGYEGMEDGYRITLLSSLDIEAEITQEYIDDEYANTEYEHRTWYWAICSGYVLFDGYADTVEEAQNEVESRWMSIVKEVYEKYKEKL